MAREADTDSFNGVGALVQRGTNQAGMRASNERLVLSLVRSHGALSKTDIARMTGLSAQTVSVIMRHLEADHLLRRGSPTRGRVGQPSVPLSLDPEGAYFLGAKVGRRSLDVVMVDFLGHQKHSVRDPHPYPMPAQIVGRIAREVAACEVLLGERASRIAGLGLALPFALWDWAEEIGAPEIEMAAWRDFDIQAELQDRIDYPVFLQNDGTAACGAELAFGDHAGLRDFAYFYIGTFVGGGLVLNGELHIGPNGNAAAFGSIPVPGPGGVTEQLIDQASLCVLERSVSENRTDLGSCLPDHAWSAEDGPVADWIAQAANGLARAIVAVTAVVDCEAIVIDGSFPPEARNALVDATERALQELDLSGLTPPRLLPGSIGSMARALGGASLPLFKRFLIEQG